MTACGDRQGAAINGRSKRNTAMILNIKRMVGLCLIVLLTLGAVVVLFFQGEIPQPLSYHDFADQRAISGIPNFLDVMSNLPFVLVGLLGLYKMSESDSINILAESSLSYRTMFIAVALVGVGSGYYHLWPDNETLVWDRIPMAVAFMALLSIIVAEFVSIRLGSILLIPLVSIGVLSVLYWHWSEGTGHGDLRPYIMVQFLPMLIIPVILNCFNSAFTKVSGYWLLISAYVLAKFLEYFDFEVFEILTFVSGHSLKHIAAAMGVYFLLFSFARRRRT
jgi:hypothetical protein